MGNFNTWLDDNIDNKLHDWSFSEASGDAIDDVGLATDVDLPPLGSPSRQLAGWTDSDPADLAAELDQSGKYFLKSSPATDSQGLSALGSVIVVAKIDSLATPVTHGRLYQTATSGLNAQGQFNFNIINDGRLQVLINRAAGHQAGTLATLTGPNPVGDGEFHTFICTQEGDGNGCKLYIDGVSQATTIGNFGDATNDSWWDWLNVTTPVAFSINREIHLDTNEITGAVSRVVVTTDAMTATDASDFAAFISSQPSTGLGSKRRRGGRRGYRPYR